MTGDNALAFARSIRAIDIDVKRRAVALVEQRAHAETDREYAYDVDALRGLPAFLADDREGGGIGGARMSGVVNGTTTGPLDSRHDSGPCFRRRVAAPSWPLNLGT